MKNIRIKKKYIVIAVLTLIVSVGTLTFAYFQGSVLNDLINPTNVSTGSIDIKISDTSVNANNVDPLFTNGNNFEKASFVKHFSVTNGTDTLNTCVELYLRINSIDSAIANSYFKYAIVNDDTSTTITGDFNGVSGGTELDLGSLYFFESSTVKNYTMYIWIEYNPDVDQMSMLGKSMNATLFVKAQDSKTKDTCDTRSTFKLTYKLDGGTGCDNTNVNKGDDVTLCTPTNTDTTLSFGGWYADNKYTSQVTSITNMSDDVKLYAMWTCTYSGTLTQGATYTNGQYVYSYKQEGKLYNGGNSESNSINSWNNINVDGWGVQLENKGPGDDGAGCDTDCGDLTVTSKVCKFINKKPVVSMSYMFSESAATTVDFNSYDTSLIINMNGMFFKSKINILDLSSFDTSNVTNMGSMFYNSQATRLDLGSFNTSNVTNMSGMFGNTKFKSIDLSSFNTSNVTNMSYMFSDSQATRLDLSSFNTSKVTNMNFMFSNSQATTLDLSSFDTSNVTNMGSMFYNSQATRLDLSSFNTSNVTKMTSMFNSSQATTLDLSNFNTSNVTNMSYMFNNSQATTLDLSNFTITSSTKITNMFSGAAATTGYAKDEATATLFNDSSTTSIPDTLKFTVK